MKKLRLFLLAGLACMALTACEKDNEEETPGREKTFGKFVMADTQLFRGEGKVVLDFDGANSKLLYENGDYVKINGYDFELTKSGSGASTVWTANGTELTAKKFYCAYVDGVNTGSVLTNFNEGGTYRFNLNTRLTQATNKILLGGVTDSNVLTLRPACAIIRLKANASYSDVKIGFEASKILKEGTMTINASEVTLSGSSYLAAVTNATGVGAELLSMEYNSEHSYWYVAVPVSGSVTTTLFLQWTVGGQTVYKKTSGQVTLQKGFVYDMGTERNSPFNTNGFSKCQFNVSSSSHVAFSAGNLQFKQVYDSEEGEYFFTWQFAPHQYSVIGSSNSSINSNNVWLDLLGYGTSGWSDGGQTAYKPNAHSPNDVDYYHSNLSGSNADWGRYIKSNPGIYYGSKLVTGKNWRTLTSSEWGYLINRTGKAGLATITINAISYTGLILLPDLNASGVAWDYATEIPSGPSFTAGSASGFSTNTYTSDQWDVLEAAGAIFIPTGGKREDLTATGSNTFGYYWTSNYDEWGFSSGSDFYASSMYIASSGYSVEAMTHVSQGCSVRLIIQID